MTKFGSDLKNLGSNGFDIIQIGNSYQIFFTAVERVQTFVPIYIPDRIVNTNTT
ncbi:MAG: hypothetical protein ACK521_06055 [bacterium]